MRALSTSAALSSLVLGGWLTAAAAQSMDSGAAVAPDSAMSGQAANSGSPAVGVIPQPSADSPGVVLGITLGELYTDNLRLASAGQAKQATWITQIQPFIRSAWSGPRFSGMFDYQLTGYMYAGQSHDNQLAHDLQAQGSLTVLPQHLFLNGSATYGRRVVDNEVPNGPGTFFLNGNQLNVAMATLGPSWFQDLGRLGSMTLGYTVGRVLYNDQGISGATPGLRNGIPNITSKSSQFNLQSPKDQKWGWTLDYSDQRIEPDSGGDIDYATAKVGISRQVGSYTRLLVDAGKENRFLPDGTSKRLGANLWDAGFEWSNTRDYLKLLVGHRFYGPSYEFAWRHTAALLTTSLGYVEQPTDINQQLLAGGPGQIISTPSGLYYIPSLRQRQVYLMKRATGSATYTLPSGNISLTLYDEQRTYLNQDDRQEKIANADLQWLFNIGPFTTLTPVLGWQRYRFQDGRVQDNVYEQLALVHQFNPKDFGSVRLRHDSRSVDQVTGLPVQRGYRVNILFVQWTHLF